MEKNNLLNYLLKYEELIGVGNKLIKEEYNLKTSPLIEKNKGIIPSDGNLEKDGIKLSFKFHGMGCLFTFTNAKVDFDYSFNDFIYKGFDPFKLHEFIISFSSPDEPLRNQSAFDNALDELSSNGVIKAKDKDSFDTYKYIRTA